MLGHFNDSLLAVKGFEYIRRDRIGTKKGGGLLVYIRTSLIPFVELIPKGMHMDGISEEVWMVLDRPGVKKPVITLIYLPPDVASGE